MSIIQSYDCDVCKTLRVKDANHWWAGWLDGLEVGIVPFSEIQIALQTVVNASDIAHLCGIECATKWVAQQLNKIIGA